MGDRITLRLGAELGDAVWGIRPDGVACWRRPRRWTFVIGSIHTLSEKMEGRDLYFLTPRDETGSAGLPCRLPGPGAEARGVGAIPGTGPSDAAPAVFEREPGDACQLRRVRGGDRGDLPPHHPQGHRASSSTPTGATPRCRTRSGCGCTAPWAARSSPWGRMPTRRGLWAVPSGRGRRCCGPADSAVLPPSGRGNRCGMNCDLLFRGKLAIINPFQPHSSPNGMT